MAFYLSGSRHQLKLALRPAPVSSIACCVSTGAYQFSSLVECVAHVFYKDFSGAHLVNRDGSGLRLIEGVPHEPAWLAWSSGGVLIGGNYNDKGMFVFYRLPISILK